MSFFKKLFGKPDIKSGKNDLYNRLRADYKYVESALQYNLFLRGKEFHITGGPSMLLSVKKQYRDYKSWSTENREHPYSLNNATYYMNDDEIEYFLQDYSNFLDAIVTRYEEMRESIRKAKTSHELESIKLPDASVPGYRDWWIYYYKPLEKNKK